MFHHIVLLRFSPDSTPEHHRAVVDDLRALPASIPELLGYDVRLDLGLGQGEAQAHVSVAASFAEEAGWRTYATHPDHLRVIRERITPIAETTLRIQYRD